MGIKAAYLKDPCGTSSLPYWKSCEVKVPESMRVLREDEFGEKMLDRYRDDPYFKLRHDLSELKRETVPLGFRLVEAAPVDFARHISICYDREGVTVQELERMKEHFTYDPALWVALEDMASGELAATGIAGIDPEIGEGILEWIQVSPAYRRRGLGRYIVCELLSRMEGRADFATVSGRINNQCKPELLYESCGFRDRVVWHVLTRKEIGV